MTPKEKAEQLYNIFDMIVYTDQNEHDQCKRCAARCVDEVLKSHDQLIYFFRESEDYICIGDYWEKVKKEISLL